MRKKINKLHVVFQILKWLIQSQNLQNSFKWISACCGAKLYHLPSLVTSVLRNMYIWTLKENGNVQLLQLCILQAVVFVDIQPEESVMSTYYFHCCFIMIIQKNDIVVFVFADLKESLAFEKLHSHCTNKL